MADRDGPKKKCCAKFKKKGKYCKRCPVLWRLREEGRIAPGDRRALPEEGAGEKGGKEKKKKKKKKKKAKKKGKAKTGSATPPDTGTGRKGRVQDSRRCEAMVPTSQATMTAV